MVSAEASHRKIPQRTVICAATKQTLQASYSGNIGTTWLGSWAFEVENAKPLRNQSRVAARGIFRVMEDLVMITQAQLEEGRHFFLLLSARSKVWGAVSVRNLPKLRAVFGSGVKGIRDDGDVSFRSSLLHSS